MLRARCPHCGAGLDEARMATGENSKEGAAGPIVDPAASFREIGAGGTPMWGEERAGPRPSSARVWLKIGGFVLLVLLFVGGLALTVGPTIAIRMLSLSSTEKAAVELTVLDRELKEYAQANEGHYPKSLLELVTPDVNGHTFLEVTDIPKDPWGNEYMYDPPEPGRPEARVYSYGKDGRAGGEGDDADIDNFSVREHH